MNDLPPPRDMEAEWAVISACFAEPSVLERNRDEILDPHNWSHPLTRAVARGLREGLPPDGAAMGEFVGRESKGHLDLFSERILAGGITSSARLEYWLPRLRRTCRLREMYRAATKILDMSTQPDCDPEEVRMLLASAARPTTHGKLPAILDASQLDEAIIERPEEIIAGALHRGCKMVLGGTSKSMKTWTLLQLAICCASGIPFWDMATRKSRVLFLNFEIQQYSFRERIRHICRALGIPIPAEQLFVWNLRGHSADLSSLRPRIVEHIRLGEFGLICFDPIYKLYGDRDENAASQMAGLMNEIDSIAVETNSSVVFGHHFSKAHGVKAGVDKMSGSGVFARDPDSIFVMHPHEEDNVLIVEPTLRDFSPIDPFCIEWDFPLMKRTAEHNPDAAKAADGQRRAYKDGSILMCIKEGGSTFKDIFDQAHKALEIPKGTLSKYLTRLISAGKVAKEKTQFGDLYRLVDQAEKVAF